MKAFRNTQTITDRNSTAMSQYLREVNRYPLISMEEEVELTRQIKKGGKEGERAKEKLIQANLRFVVSVANQYHQAALDLADLVSEGNIGLIKAAERFDDTRGFKFISFAVWWIRQSIMAAIAETGRTIRIPYNQQELLQMYNHLNRETQQTENRRPTVEEFAEFAGIDVQKAANLLAISGKLVSADSPVADDAETNIVDTITSDSITDSNTDKESLKHDLIQTITKTLKPHEREIVMRFYGIGSQEESLESISDALGLSRERTRQIRENAIKKLRDNSDLLYRYLG